MPKRWREASTQTVLPLSLVCPTKAAGAPPRYGRTYVVAVAGHRRGEVGYIAGDLHDRQGQGAVVGVTRAIVWYPQCRYPKDVTIKFVEDLRVATDAERMTIEHLAPVMT